MRRFATADCETDPFKIGRVPEPFVWGFYDEKLDEPFIYFYKTSDFVDYIKDYKGIIYAHNGGKFDWHFLLEYIDPQSDIMIINGRIAKIKIGKCELRDSFLLLPVPLSAYQKDIIDYKLFEKDVRKQHLNEIIPYLKGDCKYLYDILKLQFEEYGLKLTLATSAFDYWHSNHNKSKFKPKSNSGYFNHFKKYYYGGRVQCFEKGILKYKEFKSYDINSAYPYAMQFEHAYDTEYEALDDLPENYEQCFIHMWGVSKGVLPYRDKGLQFPNDNKEREYFCTGWELKLGIDRGLIKINKIIRVTRFKNTINFKGYVDKFYKKKESFKNGDAGQYLLAKLYLNSLYGKFGQSSIDHKNYSLIPKNKIVEYIDDHNMTFEGEMGNNALMACPIPEKHQKFYSVVTSASITGFVRAYLYSHILDADTPLYCDTDSITCLDMTCKKGRELGAWELEGEYDKGAIAGKKLYSYRFKGTEKYKNSSKGVRLGEKDIFRVASGETILYENIAPSFSIKKEPHFIKRNVRMT